MKQDIFVIFNIEQHEAIDQIPGFKNCALYLCDNPLEWGMVEYENYNLRFIGYASHPPLINYLPIWIQK